MSRQKVVFLDAATYGDISLSSFIKQWDCTIYQITSPSETCQRLIGQSVAVTNKVVIDRAVFSSAGAKELELIVVAATGTDVIDREAAREFGVRVCNVPGYATQSVAQFTLALILELATRAGRYDASVRSDAWQKSPVFTLLDFPSIELKGKKLGIIGYGNIGRAVAEHGARIWVGSTDCCPPWLRGAHSSRPTSGAGTVPASRHNHLALSAHVADEESHQRRNSVANEADCLAGQYGSRSVDR